jgi:arginine-tRNA-protein transferase
MERNNGDILRTVVPPEATREQFALLQTYLASRHAGGGMSDMGLFDYVAMVEETPVETTLVEYRVRETSGAAGRLVACALTDVLQDGLSMVYSFFDPQLAYRSLGTYMILDHVEYARAQGHPFVYLGYWIEGSRKMRYKNRFEPQERLTSKGWVRG